MPVVKAKTNIEVYKYKASAKNIHAMSGRSQEVITEYINSKIVSELEPYVEDCIVDIGCGDGSLLHSVSNVVTRGIGIVPTAEEAYRLQNEYSSVKEISFKTGLSRSLPLDTEIASKVVCNGVLLLLESVEEFSQSLKEINRISCRGCKIWIGEIPSFDENAFYNTNYGSSILKWLMFLLKRRGFKAFFQGLLSTIKAFFTKELFIITPKKLIYMEPEAFIILAESCGLKVVKYEKTKTKNSFGEEIASLTRYDYLCEKNEQV